MPTKAGRADEAIFALCVGRLYDEVGVKEKCKAAAEWLSRCLQAGIAADRLAKEWDKLIANEHSIGTAQYLGVSLLSGELGDILWEFYAEAIGRGAGGFVVFNEDPEEEQYPTMYLVAVHGNPSEIELGRCALDA